jgi:ribonuclease BN (tRNA processing enzyme)
LGYRLTADDEVLVYATDNEPFGKAPASRHLVRPSRLLSLAYDAGLLIQDAQYTPDEYRQHVGWGHATYLDALRIAQQAKVKRLALFHHDPDHSDAEIDRIVVRCRAWIKRRGLSLTCLGAAEGTRLVL